jgi:two-component system phosphate regulon sensor histidine kinase PhoR
MKLRSKVGLLLFSVGVVVVAAAGVFTYVQVESFFMQRIDAELETHARTMEHVLRTLVDRPGSEESYGELQQLARTSGIRLTLIAEDGRVLLESNRPYSELDRLENYLTRPEVQSALSGGSGKSQRHSTTVDTDMLYLAKRLTTRLPDSSPFQKTEILRVGVPLTELGTTLGELRMRILYAVAGVTILVVLLAFVLLRQITRPIAAMASVAETIRAGNLDRRIVVRSGDEIGKLADTLNGMIDKLNEDIGQLRKLERVRSQFLGNVSHELRTPLFALQTAIDTLLGGAVDDASVNREFLGKALHHTRRLDELLTDLIEISRIESGEMKMSFRYFDVHAFLRECVSETAEEAAKKGIALTCDLPSDPLEVMGDRERLRQVMENLLLNGVKYTNSGGRVMVAAETTDGMVKISVSDTGAGIAVEHLPRIFERFYRVDKDRSREVGGTGLGLAIVKHIVEAHGSKVEVQSEIGKGSVFSFMLKK